MVEGYNNDPAVHGILVQLPLPGHINERQVLDAISLEKDVDGFHPFNIGSLAMRGREPLFVSCTPKVPPPPLIRRSAPRCFFEPRSSHIHAGYGRRLVGRLDMEHRSLDHALYICSWTPPPLSPAPVLPNLCGKVGLSLLDGGRTRLLDGRG